MAKITSFKSNFKEALDNCWKCYITDGVNEKQERERYYGWANNSLTELIKTCEEIISNNDLSSKIIEEAIEAKKIAEGAQKECRGCSYRDTKIKNYLEGYGINVH